MKLTKKQMEAIIAKLPVTLDGVPVIPTIDSVYHPDLLDDEKTPAKLFYNDYNYYWTSPIDEGKRKAEECYSTLELAIKAQKSSK